MGQWFVLFSAGLYLGFKVWSKRKKRFLKDGVVDVQMVSYKISRLNIIVCGCVDNSID